MNVNWGFLATLLVLSLLVACSSSNYAPVDDRANKPYGKVDSHVVGAGETLFSIAWRHGIDYKQLAYANGIGSPYTIYPAQTLQLKAKKPPSRPVAKSAPAKPAKRPAPPVRVKKPARPAPKSAANATAKAYPFRWQWPSDGKLTQAFSLSGSVHKGIDLKGKLRDPVRAANSGKVVYAGSNLVGYGKLLIIKHNDRYLSAYGHNHRLLVTEGQAVKVGQVIAEMGNSGTDTVKLHFEIRRDGKPVNPSNYLPRR